MEHAINIVRVSVLSLKDMKAIMMMLQAHEQTARKAGVCSDAYLLEIKLMWQRVEKAIRNIEAERL